MDSETDFKIDQVLVKTMKDIQEHQMAYERVKDQVRSYFRKSLSHDRSGDADQRVKTSLQSRL